MNAPVDVLAIRQKVRWLLLDCRTQRRYMREGWGALMVKSAPTPHYTLKACQRALIDLRQQLALGHVGGAA